MPKYLAIAAITLDGRIAATTKHFSDWTSPEDKEFLREILSTCDVVLVGNNTYKTAKQPLSKRNCIVLTSKVKTITQKTENLCFFNPKKSSLAKYISNKGYKRVGLLGGAQAYTYCLENNLLNDLYLTLEPIVFGKGISLFQSKKFIKYNFKLISVKQLNSAGSLLMHYKK